MARVYTKLLLGLIFIFAFVFMVSLPVFHPVVYADDETPSTTETGQEVGDGGTENTDTPTPPEGNGEGELSSGDGNSEDEQSNTYKINYNGLPTYSDISSLPETYKAGSSVNFKSEEMKPTLYGYVFLGWYKDEEYTTEASITADTTGDVTVWAKVRHNIITIKYEGWDYESEQVEYGTAVRTFLGDKNPTKKGYEFIGWFTSDRYTQKLGENALIYGEDGEVQTLYAKFEKRAEPWIYYTIYAFAGVTVLAYIVWWIAFKPKKERIDA